MSRLSYSLAGDIGYNPGDDALGIHEPYNGIDMGHQKHYYTYRTFAKKGSSVVHLKLDLDWGMGRYSKYHCHSYMQERPGKLPTRSSLFE